jgi:RNA polymerase sigma-70 factor (sigma-E family)
VAHTDVPPSAEFDERFDDLIGLAYRVAYRLVGEREEARDIAQETMSRTYARWSRVRARAPGWVAKVATNLALDHLRRRRPEPVGDHDDGATRDPGAATADHGAPVITRLELVGALRALPRRQRDVVVLRYVADLAEADVARALGCSPGTVKSHGHRGLAALRAAIGPTISFGEGTL